eukprot:scaffold2995_cov130-Cylindrotheca_fusiformis.AAC.4
MSQTPQHEIAAGRSPPAVSVDKLLAAELEKLSLKEREKVFEDVHGVSDAVQETPAFVSSCLEKMDREIDLINDKDAYEQAKLQSLNLVPNRQFQLLFLRCNAFNPKTAALHLVQYFTNRLEMFGPENLAKSMITIDDIGEATRRVLELGSMQVLPCRDSKGRAVVVCAPSVMEPAMSAYDDPIPSLIKAIIYLVSTVMEDEETQKKGVVFVANVSGVSARHEQCHRKLAMRLLALADFFPTRVACLHFCYNSSSRFAPILLSVLASAATSILRVRIRTHDGSHTEWLYKLMSFGIPIQEFPFTEDGGIQLANHVNWLEKRRKKEEYLRKNPPVEGAVDLPSNHDVLWGRGKQVFQHAGNRLFHELVDAYGDQYNRLSKDGKTKLADQIVAVVHGYSGRFRKLNEARMWVEVSNLEAREKVTHRFRHNRALGLKGRPTRTSEPNVAMKSKQTDGGGKRPRMMFNGS